MVEELYERTGVMCSTDDIEKILLELAETAIDESLNKVVYNC